MLAHPTPLPKPLNPPANFMKTETYTAPSRPNYRIYDRTGGGVTHDIHADSLEDANRTKLPQGRLKLPKIMKTQTATRLFHGTTADAARSILAQGFKTEEGGANWNVSGDATYFWSFDALVEHGEIEEGDDEFRAVQMAFESAQFGLPWSKDCRAIVFEVDGSQIETEPDQSCQNMSGAVSCGSDIPAKAIVKAWITEDLSLLRGWFLSFHLKRDWAARELEPLEEKIAEVMQKLEIYDDLEEIAQLREISIPDLKTLLS